MLLAAYAFRLDRESLRPLWALPLQQFVYRQLMYLVIIEATVSALVGSPAIAGQNRGGPTALGCYFIVSGTRQAFGISVGAMPCSSSNAAL